MMYIHPVMQVLFTLVAVYAFYLGQARFRSLHLGQVVRFRRRRHIMVGRIALAGWLMGTLLGLYMARDAWHVFFVTGWHGYLGMVFLGLILLGMISGWVLYSKPKKRKVLPLLHGLANTMALLIAFVQFYLGYEVVQVFLWGA